MIKLEPLCRFNPYAPKIAATKPIVIRSGKPGHIQILMGKQRRTAGGLIVYDHVVTIEIPVETILEGDTEVRTAYEMAMRERLH